MAVTKQLSNSEETISLTDTVSITSNGRGYSTIDYGAIPTISMSDLTLGNIAFSSGTSSTYALGPGLNANTAATWTTTGTGTGWNHSAVGATLSPKASLSLQGDDADIEINGKSMKGWMEKVEERLNILTPNPELEKDWDELRKLGEKYRKLEKKCKEKAEVWKKLKSMPPPSMD